MKTFIVIIIVAAVAIGLGYYILTRGSGQNVSLSSPTPTENGVSPSPGSTAFSVDYTSNGVSPKTLNIKAGDTVTFVNDDVSPHWPASNPHPLHTDCPGFDALRGLKTGETYSFTFTQAKTCGFHDHLNAGNSAFYGTIIVSE